MLGPWYDVVWMIAATGVLVLTGFALRAWWKKKFSSSLVGIFWFLVILLVPVVGPLLFLALNGSTRARPVAVE